MATFDAELAGLSLPKIRSRAALYLASRSRRDSCAELLSAEGVDGIAEGEVAVGRLRIFILGSWSKTP